MVTVETDSRSRVSLRQAGVGPKRQYLVHVSEDGVVTLTPAVTLSEAEVRYLNNPELVARVEDNRAHPERLVERTRTPR